MSSTDPVIPSVDELKPGTLITIPIKVGIFSFSRNLKVDHYDIYVGDGKVVHNQPGTGWMMAGNEGGVVISTIEEFVGLSCDKDDEWAKIKNLDDTDVINFNEEVICQFSNEEIAARAIERIGKERFHLKTNNSEHFVMECCFGIRKSNQFGKAMYKHFLDNVPHLLEGLAHAL